MAQMTTPTTRQDTLIADDIRRMIQSYPPARNDSHRIDVRVEGGAVTLSGYVKSEPTFAYIRGNIPRVAGVTAFDDRAFFNDDGLRRAVGQVVPPGVQVRVEYGAAILTGLMPVGVSVEEIVKRVGLVEGIHRVLTHFV